MTAPIPGDPDAVREAARSVSAGAGRLDTTAGDLRGTAAGVGARWTGPAADTAGAATARYGPAVEVGVRSGHAVARTLAAYAEELRAAQVDFERAAARYATGRHRQGLLADVPLLAGLAPGHEDVSAGLAGMAAARDRAVRANEAAARAVDARTAELVGLTAAMPTPGGPSAGFGGGGPGPSPGVPRPRSGDDCALTLSCTIADFQAMSIPERTRFATAFDRLYGRRLTTGGRFANVGGVLRFFDDDGLGGQGTWVSWVDASILHGFERGAAMQLGRPGGSQGNPGADAWERYFSHQQSTSGDSGDTSDRLWSEAEQASTRNGYGVANDQGTGPGIPEAAFAGGGEIYRWGLRHETGVKEAAGVVAGPVLGPLAVRAVDDFADPSNPWPSYLGGHVMHGGGQYVQGQIRLLTGNPVGGVYDVASGGVEVARYGGEGVVKAGGWLWDHTLG